MHINLMFTGYIPSSIGANFQGSVEDREAQMLALFKNLQEKSPIPLRMKGLMINRANENGDDEVKLLLENPIEYVPTAAEKAAIEDGRPGFSSYSAAFKNALGIVQQMVVGGTLANYIVASLQARGDTVDIVRSPGNDVNQDYNPRQLNAMVTALKEVLNSVSPELRTAPAVQTR